MNSTKLAIVLSHPVQYYSPLFVVLAKEIDLKVFYAFKPDARQQGKEGFGKAFEWDLDLLSGYDYEFVDNVAKSPSSAYFAGCDTPKLGERLKAFGTTHLISFGWYLKMHRQALRYCKKNRIPIAIRGDSQLDPQLPSWKKLLKRLYYPYFLKQYDSFLSVGERNREYLRYYGIPDKQIIFSPHAIDQDFWRVKRTKATEKFRFIWVAKFIPKKRPLDAIRAFKMLLKAEPQLKDKVELRMVGSGTLLEQAKAIAGGASQISFPGFKNQLELKEEYAKSDCLVLTSDYRETWGLVVNEGFAAGIPAIVSEACGCSTDLIEEDSGLSYPLAEVTALARCMQVMYNKTSAPETHGEIQTGIAKKNKTYSNQRNVKSFQQFLEIEWGNITFTD